MLPIFAHKTLAYVKKHYFFKHKKEVMRLLNTKKVMRLLKIKTILFVHIKSHLYKEQLKNFVINFSFKFGNYVNTIFKFASIDSGFSEIILPEDEYNNVINYIDPLYDTETNLLTVDCSKINILPNLTFAIEGYDKLVNMNVTSSNYVLDVSFNSVLILLCLKHYKIQILN